MIVPLYIEYDSFCNSYIVGYIEECEGEYILYKIGFSFYDSAKDLYSKLQGECIRELTDFQPESKDL